MISRIFLTILLVASVIFIVQKGPASVKQPAPSRQSSSQPSSSGHRLADSMQAKLDHIQAGQNSFNPMLSIFSGQHDVQVEADASGSGREGSVHVRNVVIDGITVPKMALEYFVSKYITPKYPNVGIDSQFQLPNKIDIATVGYHKVTVTQK